MTEKFCKFSTWRRIHAFCETHYYVLWGDGYDVRREQARNIPDESVVRIASLITTTNCFRGKVLFVPFLSMYRYSSSCDTNRDWNRSSQTHTHGPGVQLALGIFFSLTFCEFYSCGNSKTDKCNHLYTARIIWFTAWNTIHINGIRNWKIIGKLNFGIL